MQDYFGFSRPYARNEKQMCFRRHSVPIQRPGGTRYLSIRGGPCQQFISEPQILSHSFEEPQILSVRSLRPVINVVKYSGLSLS